jgi:hypothetical protein
LESYHPHCWELMKSPWQLITAIHDEEGDGRTHFSKSARL